MGPKGHSSKDVRIPVRNRMMEAQLVEEKPLHAKIELYEVIPDEEVTTYYDIFEKVETKGA